MQSSRTASTAFFLLEAIEYGATCRHAGFGQATAAFLREQALGEIDEDSINILVLFCADFKESGSNRARKPAETSRQVEIPKSAAQNGTKRTPPHPPLEFDAYHPNLPCFQQDKQLEARRRHSSLLVSILELY